MALKTFIYLSMLKVDMLFDQLPEARVSRLATEMKGDLKLVGISQTEEQSFESRAARLDLVLSALRSEDAIGDLDNPLAYVAGEIAMAWGPVDLHRSGSLEDTPASPEYVLFAGSPDGHRIVGLIGSRAHLIGEEGKSVYMYYTRPSALRCIAEGMRGDAAALAENPREHELISTGDAAHRMALEYPEADKQRVEFVARTYRLDKHGVLLGSPLYVALADNPFQAQRPDGQAASTAASGDGVDRVRRKWIPWRK